MRAHSLAAVEHLAGLRGTPCTKALKPAARSRNGNVEDAVVWALGARGKIRSRSPGSAGRRKRAHRPAEPVRHHARPVRPDRRHLVRAGRACAVGARRHADRRDRGAGCGQRTGTGLRARRIMARCSAGARRRHHRRRARRQSVRPAPDQGGRRARPFPRRDGRVRPRRDLQVGRPGGEERHRLRPLQAAGRLLRHARRHDRCHDQDAAARRDRGHDPARASTTRQAAAAMAEAHGIVLRRVGRGASAGGVAPQFAALQRTARSRRSGSKALRPRSRIARACSPHCSSPFGGDRRSGERARARSGARSATCTPFAGEAADRPVWRVSTAPSRARASRLGRRPGGDVLRLGRRAALDGVAAFGRCRQRSPSAAQSQAAGGHATLIRAPAAIRAAVAVFEPQDAGVAALTRRVKDSFDPKGILNPGRMWAGV